MSSVRVTGGAGDIGSHAVKALVRAVLSAVARVTGRKVPCTVGPRREGDPAILFTSSDRVRREPGWPPRYEEEVETIVETAWRRRERHPHGYPAGVMR
jgi:UDP-glucose 4-epimerase